MRHWDCCCDNHPPSFATDPSTAAAQLRERALPLPLGAALLGRKLAGGDGGQSARKELGTRALPSFLDVAEVRVPSRWPVALHAMLAGPGGAAGSSQWFDSSDSKSSRVRTRAQLPPTRFCDADGMTMMCTLLTAIPLLFTSYIPPIYLFSNQ